MPEGDTVWNTARVLHRALAGARLTGSRLPGAAAGHHRPHRLDRRASRPAAASTCCCACTPRTTAHWTLHSHLRMDGAWRAYAPGERWAAGPAHLIRVVLRSPGRGRGRLPPARAGPGADRGGGPAGRAPRPRPARAGLGPGRGGPPARRPPRRRPSARRCSTSATWPGWATSTSARCCSCAACRRGRRSATVPDLPGMVALAQRLLAANRGRWTQSTTGSLHRGADQLRVRPPRPAVPPLRHGDPQGGAGRAGHLLVPASASPSARTRRYPADQGARRPRPSQIRTIG